MQRNVDLEILVEILENGKVSRSDAEELVRLYAPGAGPVQSSAMVEAIVQDMISPGDVLVLWSLRAMEIRSADHACDMLDHCEANKRYCGGRVFMMPVVPGEWGPAKSDW